MKGRRVRLLTVAGAAGAADVAVAADVPVGELRPALARLVGGGRRPPDDPGWALHAAEGTALRPAATLHGQEVHDGAVLYLHPSLPSRTVEEPPDEQPRLAGR